VQRERRRLRRADDDAAVRTPTRDDAAANFGAVATPRQLVVSAIEPVVDGGYNKAIVLRLPLDE
jgi:hypothetical protein